MKNYRVLLVGDQGDHFLISLETTCLFNRAGFQVDLVSNNPTAKHLTSISDFTYVQSISELPFAGLNKLRSGQYDLIVVLEDFTLKAIRDSDLSDDDKLDLLPVLKKENLRHLCSKIELSRLFSREGILTPDFAVAHCHTELASRVEELGYPVLVKVDFSGAGAGTFKCVGPRDIEAIGRQTERWPVLVQKFIEGTELDLSAFYQDSQLVCCSYSRFERAMSEFGPSSVRTYTQLAKVEQKLFKELQAIGRVTGANGFANIVCILSKADHRRYYIEADMRPNAWINAPEKLGDDPALRISTYFTEGKSFTSPPPLDTRFPDQLVIPCSTRLKLWELAVNRYGSWSCLPKENWVPICLALAEPKMREFARGCIKPLVPTELWSRFKGAYDSAYRKVMAWHL